MQSRERTWPRAQPIELCITRRPDHRIPKSVTPSRIARNYDISDFEFGAEQLAAIDTLDTDVGGGPEPDQITREK